MLLRGPQGKENIVIGPYWIYQYRKCMTSIDKMNRLSVPAWILSYLEQNNVDVNMHF